MNNESNTADNNSLSFLQGGGEQGARIREFDWSQTSLGPAHLWPQSLKTCVRILLTSRQPMFVWWGDELINIYNDAYKAIVGGKHPEALGQPASIVWREIWDQIRPRAESALLKNEGTYDESLLLIMERYGYREETYYTFSYSPVPNDQGGTSGIICANSDDTQRIIGERQLNLLRDLATRAADARSFDEACNFSVESLKTNPCDLPFAMIYLTDLDKRHAFLACSCGIEDGHQALPLSVDLDNGSGWPLLEVLKTHKPYLVENLSERFDQLPPGHWQCAPHQAAILPLATAGQTGKLGFLIVGLNPYRLFDDKYRGFLELVSGQIAASIANAQAYEEERKRAEALAQLDHAKTTFFSNVSHEFRTPLTLLLGPVEDALSGAYGSLPEEHKTWVETVRRNGLRLLKLVNTLLNFSRIEAGRLQAIYEPIDLSAYTAELASIFRSAVEKAGLKLIIDCPPLPEAIYVDRDMWEKVVLNLLSNAIKFTFDGQIAISLKWQNSHVVLTVSDTGTAIPPEAVPHLFERFYRVQGAKSRTHEGTGIGLALIQELIKLHGGEISVVSEIGKGTTFTVQLPTGNAHLPSDRVRHISPISNTSRGFSPYVEEVMRWLPDSDGANTHSLAAVDNGHDHSSDELAQVAGHSKAQILLADDNADMREYVRRLLSQRWQVTAVTNGLEALQLAQQNLPDLILSDVMMPELDGFGLLKELRANDKTSTVPVILLSARAGEEACVEGLQAGADDYLVKPFSARELLARVGTHLELARIRKAATRQAEIAQNKVTQILESITDGFLAIDKDWVYTFVNKRGAELVRKSIPELVGQVIWEVFPDIRETKLYADFQHAMKYQINVISEHFHPNYNIWYENHIYPNEEGIAVFFRDITERKTIEEERVRLLEQERLARLEAERANHNKDTTIDKLKKTQQELARLASIIEFCQDPIMSQTLEGVILSWNSGAEKLYGYTPKEIIGRHISTLVPSEYISDIPKILMPIHRGESINNFETVHINKEGRWIYISLTIFPIKDEKGEIINASIIVRDLTERKMIERERAKLLKGSM